MISSVFGTLISFIFSGSDGKDGVKCSPAAGFVSHSNTTPMIFNNPVGKTETQTGPLAFLFGRVKRVKYVGYNVFRNPGTAVRYLDADLFFAGHLIGLYRQLALAVADGG